MNLPDRIILVCMWCHLSARGFVSTGKSSRGLAGRVKESHFYGNKLCFWEFHFRKTRLCMSTPFSHAPTKEKMGLFLLTTRISIVPEKNDFSVNTDS